MNTITINFELQQDGAGAKIYIPAAFLRRMDILVGDKGIAELHMEDRQ
jgi:hypothetical protein